MNVTFLLGAGISRDALPLSVELDSIVQSGKASDGRVVARHSDGLYDLVLAGGPPVRDPWSLRVRAFLGWLLEQMGGEARDYEALYFACQQLDDHLAGEYENALLLPFLAECEERVPVWWGPDSPEASPEARPARARLGQVTRETRNYIAGAVAGALTHGRGIPPDYGRMHRPLLDACRDSSIRFLDVVTLNHDTLLEASFAAAGLTVEDGFRPSRRRSAEVDHWYGYRRKGASQRRLVKLHGSIDWWEIAGSRSRLVRLKAGTRQWNTASRPRMLIGTSNKMLEYLKPFNVDRLAVFRRSLIRSDGLVVAGYSFRDKGVNDLLIDWCWNRKQHRRLTVISPGLKGNRPPTDARGAIKRSWDRLFADGRLLPIPVGFDAAEWPAVRALNAGAQAGSVRSQR